MRNIDKFRGCLIGGAAGDALGYAVEFKREDEIFSEYGKDGITEYDLILDNDVAEISDDTQMTLFTAEGMLLAVSKSNIPDYISSIREMYQCWYQTQSEVYPVQDEKRCSRLMRVPELFHRRCPGTTCMTEIKAGANGTVEVPINDRKGSRQTAVKTKLGTIEYSRRIYYDTIENKHIFLLDEAISPQSVGLYDEVICKSIEDMICNQSFRETAKSISENTGLDITHQAVWNIVQSMGEKQIEEYNNAAPIGSIESKILYEEADGDWLNLQGEDRKKYGKSKEMKIGIAYDGVLHQTQKGGKIRKELDNKVAYASFETAAAFRKHKENVIASVYNTDEIELRVKNGDGANWIQKDNSCECICVLDKFHRNKKITECVSDKEIAENLRNFLFQNRFDELLVCIEAYINSSEDEREKAKLQELYRYYSENKEALAGYRDRGISIPPTRKPGEIFHANLGSMEGNVFTIIGNRMKGRRACWSVAGGNRLAALLCKHYSVNVTSEPRAINDSEYFLPPLSAAKAPKKDGKGYEFTRNISIPPNMKWLKNISSCKPFTDLNF